MACTTARVVAWPTAWALRPAAMPCRHPATATNRAYTVPLNRPINRWVRVTASRLRCRKSNAGTPKITTATAQPAATPTKAAMAVSSGATSTRASTRGSTR